MFDVLEENSDFYDGIKQKASKQNQEGLLFDKDFSSERFI